MGSGVVRHLSEDFETRGEVFGASMHCRVAELDSFYLFLYRRLDFANFLILMVNLCVSPTSG